MPSDTLSAAGDRNISIGRDAFGNVIVSGDRNDVHVSVFLADRRLLAAVSRDKPAAENPYRGLDSFYETDSRWFFGREKLISRIWVIFQDLQRGNRPRILPVVGPSGSGKSSLVRAGLIPELARQPLDGLEAPIVVVLRPGPTPLASLKAVLEKLPSSENLSDSLRWDRDGDPHCHNLHSYAELACAGKSGSRLVVVVDQFEELYTECVDLDARSIFLENLEFAASQSDKLVTIVLAVRNDFIGAIKSPDVLSKSIRENRLSVWQMDRSELVAAISSPAELLGYPWPPALVESLAGQCEGRPGSLPLLQFALKKLWPRNISGQLDDSSWSRHLIEDFLVQAADALFDSTGSNLEERKETQGIVRRAFLAMVQFGEGAADTRRVARLSEFALNASEQTRILSALAPFTAPDARLITASELDGEPTFELTHEALISSWDRLREWLGNFADKERSASIRSDLRLHRRLSVASREWKSGQGGLWRTPELDLAIAYKNRMQSELTSAEDSFIDAGVKDQKKAQARLRLFAWGLAALASFLAIALSLSVYFWNRSNHDRVQIANALHEAEAASRRAADSQKIAESERDNTKNQLLARQADALRQSDPSSIQVANLLALEAYQRAPSSQTYEVLGKNLQYLLTPISRLLLSDTSGIAAVAYSPVGTLVAAGAGPDVYVWDSATGQEAFKYSYADIAVSDRAEDRKKRHISSLSFSADGRYLAFSDSKTFVVWDVTEKRELVKEDGESVSFVPRTSAVAIVSLELRPSRTQSLRIYDIPSRSEVAKVPLPGAGAAFSFSDDGRLLAVGGDDRMAFIFDLQLKKEVQRISYENYAVTAVAFSTDGKVLATGSQDQSVRFWDVASGKQIWDAGCGERIQEVKFSPTGRFVAAGCPGHVKLWDYLSHREVADIEVSRNVWALQFSPDDSLLATGGRSAQLWSTRDGSLYGIAAHDGGVANFRFSPDSKKLITGGDDGSARLWLLDRGGELSSFKDELRRQMREAENNNQSVLRLALADAVFSPDMRYVGLSYWNYITISRIDRTQPTLRIRSPVLDTEVSFDRNGHAAVTSDDHVTVFDLASGKEVNRIYIPYQRTRDNIASIDSKVSVRRSILSVKGSSAGVTNPEVVPIWDHGSLKSALSLTDWSQQSLNRWLSQAKVGSRPAPAAMVDSDSIDDPMRMRSSGTPDNPKTVVWNSQGSNIAILVDDHAWIANPWTGEILGSLIHGYSVERFNGYSLELGQVKGETPILSLMKPISGKYVGDDRYLFTRARSDGNDFVFVWEAATGKLIQRFLGGKSGVDASPDGERVAANGTEWNVKSGVVLSRTSQDQDVKPSFDPSGSKLAYLKQREIRLFDALNGKEIRTIVDDQVVRKLVWTPDGQYLAAVGSNVVHIWSVADGKLEISLEFPKFIVSFGFSSTDNAAIAVMSEGSVLKRLWRPQDLQHEACRRLVRNLTNDEWEKFFGSEPYRESCPGLPNVKLRERTHRI